MPDETIVAIYDTEAHADATVRDLTAAGIAMNAISREPSTGAGRTTTTIEAPVREKGFWSSLFGGDSDDVDVYDRSIESGSHVVSVRVSGDQVNTALKILESHSPIDIDERAASYGLADTTATTTTRAALGTAAAAAAPVPAARPPALPTGVKGAVQTGGDTLQLAEEQLAVGKRVVNRGTTRIRRFVVETPVEANVTLHSERVSIERRPVTGNAPVTDADFTDKTIEMTETAEEAVVSKTVRVTEEVGLRKEVADKVETVRDTVRREDVEITRDGVVETATTRPAPVPPVRR